MEYTLIQNVKVLYGLGVLSKATEVIKNAGYKKPLLVYDKGIETSDILYRLKDRLIEENIAFSEFNEVIPDPSGSVINKAGELYRIEDCDCILAIGGGSTIDTAKGVNIVGHFGGSILDYAEKEFDVCNGLISIPTTAGTGAELSQGIIVTDEENDRKIFLLAYNSMSEYAIIDPELTMSLSPTLTAFTGLDVFSHSAEAYTTIYSNMITDLICEKVMDTVVENLQYSAISGMNIEKREKMASASALSGWMIYNSSVHIGHSLAHVIGNVYHVPHGLACAYTLPVMLEFTADVCTDKVKKIGEILGAEFTGNEDTEKIGEMSSAAYTYFRDSINGMKSLKDFGVTKKSIITDVDILSKKLKEASFNKNCPKAIGMEEAREILNIFARHI